MSGMVGMGWEEFENVKGKVNGMKELVFDKETKDMVKDAKKYLFEACHEVNAVSPIVALMYLFRNWKGEKK